LRNRAFLRVLPNTSFCNGLRSDVSIVKGKVIKKAYGVVGMNLLLHFVYFAQEESSRDMPDKRAGWTPAPVWTQ
jgi:hypothetical protein